MLTASYESQWNEVAPRIDEAIDKNRKSDVTLRIVDPAGKPLPGAKVRIEQTNSAYLFGSNIFMYGGYPSDAMNRGYLDAFLGLFNAATVPFYWRDLEPEPGNLRFTAESRPIYRRPAPDPVVAFCKQHNLNMNGHCLVWDFIKWSMPDWYPDDLQKGAALLEKRIREIAERYGHDIPRWDVLNEALLTPERLQRKQSRVMPEYYELLAFKLAQKHFPQSAHLMINEITAVFWGWAERYVKQIRQLIADGARIKGVGMQFHAFSNDENLRIMRGELHRPSELLQSLDTVGELGLPIHISEITLTALENDHAGQKAQARVASNFYRLWFSHPATHAITWWNLPDGGAAPGEDSVFSGLVDRQMKPKLAYDVLHDLIRRQWRTNLDAVADEQGTITFRGFHGEYRATVDGRSIPFQVKQGTTAQETLHVR